MDAISDMLTDGGTSPADQAQLEDSLLRATVGAGLPWDAYECDAFRQFTAMLRPDFAIPSTERLTGAIGCSFSLFSTVAQCQQCLFCRPLVRQGTG